MQLAGQSFTKRQSFGRPSLLQQRVEPGVALTATMVTASITTPPLPLEVKGQDRMPPAVPTCFNHRYRKGPLREKKKEDKAVRKQRRLRLACSQRC